jgi:hypothetical protein
MTRKALAVAAVLTLAGGCGGGSPAAAPRPAPGGGGGGGGLLTQSDLPDGWTASSPDAAPEVSAASTVSVPGCEAVLDYFRDGAADDGKTARFEAGDGGPFLAESLGADPDIAATAGRCGSFTDTDADGTATSVSVASVADFPKVGDDERVFQMRAGGGTGDDSFELSGYLLVIRVGATTCTLVHFGQPGVDRAETETIARAAAGKLRR